MALQKLVAWLRSLIVPSLMYVVITFVAAVPGILLSAFLPCLGADIGFFEMATLAPLVGFLWMIPAPLGGNRFLGAAVGFVVYIRILFGSIEHIPVSSTDCKRLVWPLEGRDCPEGDCRPKPPEYWQPPSGGEYEYEDEEPWEDAEDYPSPDGW